MIPKLCADAFCRTSCCYFTLAVMCELDPYLLLAGVVSVTSSAELCWFIPPESLANGSSPLVQWTNTGVSPIPQVWPADSKGNSKMLPEKSMPGRQNLTSRVFCASHVPQKGQGELIQRLADLRRSAEHPQGAVGLRPNRKRLPARKQWHSMTQLGKTKRSRDFICLG